MDNTKVYVVMACAAGDCYSGYNDGETWIQSVHRTEEAAYKAKQAKEVEQLQEQLARMQAKPDYNPELSNRWCVKAHLLND